MIFLNTFFQRITTDFHQKELLPLKLLFFVNASTLYVLYPYLTIHMRELGINVEEAAIMSAVTPIVAIVMPPLAGIVADRIGNFKALLSIFSVLGGVTSLLLVTVPVGRITYTYPERVLFHLHCSTPGKLSISLAEDYPCEVTKEILDSRNPNSSPASFAANLEACGLMCDRDPNKFFPASVPTKGPRTLSEEVSAILRSRSYTVVVRDEDSNSTDNYFYTLNADDVPLFRTPNPHDDDARNNRKMKTAGHFRTSVRKLIGNRYFFPASGLYNFSCPSRDTDSRMDAVNINDSNDNSTSGSGNSCFIERTNHSESMGVPSTSTYLITSADESGYRMNIKIRLEPPHSADSNNKAMDISFIIDAISLPLQSDNRKFLELRNGTCKNQGLVEMWTVHVPLLNAENSLEVDSVVTLDRCQPGCVATVDRDDLCSNPETTVDYNISLTFWLYLVVRVFIGVISGTSFAMFEGAVIAILREHKADYGLQRIYAAIGGMISSPLSGMLIDYASRNKGYTDFRPAFYLYAGLKIVSGALMLTIDLQFKTPAANVVSDVLTVLKNVEIVALFISYFILGAAWGYIESFLFWLLQDLGASRSLMGITITIGGVAGLPLLVMSGPIIDRIGHANVLFIGFIFYSIRLLGYSLIYNPWMCLIFEAMESVTSSLAVTAAVTYAAKLSTNTTDSSIQGLLGGIYLGVGKGAGSLIGGFLMNAVGTRPTYQIFSAVTLVTGCIYYIFNRFYLERRRLLGEKKPEPVKSVGISNSIFDKERETKKDAGNCDNAVVKGANRSSLESVPLNTTASIAKRYTIDYDGGGGGRGGGGGGGGGETPPSCHVNLGFEIDDNEAKVRNRRPSIDESRNNEKR